MTPKKLVIIGVVKLAVIAVAIGVVFSIYGGGDQGLGGQDTGTASQMAGGH